MKDDYTLHEAAIRGDEETVCRLVLDGADVNASDAGGTSVVGALILGAASLEEIDASRARASAHGRLAILSFLFDRRAFSLYTLNVSRSCLNGLTPLGMAAYLNRLDFVSVLLERGDNLVLVDGVDSHRATPIMYAARDGHAEVLRYLIYQGARPDSVDCHHRSVLFYAVSEPQCLWTLEKTLRQRRAGLLLCHKKKKKLKLALQHDANHYNSLVLLYQQHTAYPYPSDDLRSSLKNLVHSITLSDLHTVHSLLFPSTNLQTTIPTAPSVLVNLPDEKGWSPLHYCITAPKPSTGVLDALFLAGADLTLYTADNRAAPLHVLARFGGASEGTSFRLYTFIVHLVRDLDAPLDAVDHSGNTCVHIAARQGQCIDILMAFLECDVDGEVRKMRNNDGLTAFDVAKAEYRMAFEPEDISMRPDSAASMRTIKPSFSSTSLTSSYSSTSSDSSSSLDDELEPQEQFPPVISREKESLRGILTSSADAKRLLEDLEHVSEQVERTQDLEGSGEADAQMAELDDVEASLNSSWRNSSEILEQFRQLIDAELDDMRAVRNVHISLEHLVVQLEHRVRADLRAKLMVDTRKQTLPLRNRSSLGSFGSRTGTPTLIASGSSSHSSFTSLTDQAALTTPTGSPRFGPGDAERKFLTDAGACAENELDFACALAEGSMARMRRAAPHGMDFDPDRVADADGSPLEAGVNLFSVSPGFTPDIGFGESLKEAHCGSWLDPYIRKANRDTFQAHLANLLEIQKTLFGEEDAEREHAPDPHLNVEEHGCWREGVEAVHDDGGGNFLEMVEGDDPETGGVRASGNEAPEPATDVLDLFGGSTSLEAHPDELETAYQESSAPEIGLVEPTTPGRPSTLDILEKARCEVLMLEEAMGMAECSIESAQQYVSQAERLTSRIFQAKEHTIQAARLSVALRDLCAADEPVYTRAARISTSDLCARAPASSPIVERMPVGGRFPRPSVDTRVARQAAMRSPLSQVFSASPPASAVRSSMETDDVRALRRLLVRKIPGRLDGAVDKVDKVGAWVGVIQAVVRNVEQTRL